MDRDKIQNKHCINCGAPVSTEICPYCHAATGIDTWRADMEYPVIDCNEAGIGFWSVAFPMIFAVGFGFFGFVFPIAMALTQPLKELLPMIIFLSIFGIVGVVAFVIGIKPVIRYFKIKSKGKDIEGTVYGYINDDMLLNGVPAQIVKILVNTNDGPKFILYQLGDIKQPYKINSKIKLRVYKNIFYIVKDNKNYFD